MHLRVLLQVAILCETFTTQVTHVLMLVSRLTAENVALHGLLKVELPAAGGALQFSLVVLGLHVSAKQRRVDDRVALVTLNAVMLMVLLGVLFQEGQTTKY